MYIHNLNPIIFEFGILSLRWYSLAYLVGIIFGWWYGKKIILLINNRHNKSYKSDLFDDFITYIIIAIVIGGRLGYVFFYNFNYLWETVFHIMLTFFAIVKEQDISPSNCSRFVNNLRVLK